jgi:hypothetical protein
VGSEINIAFGGPRVADFFVSYNSADEAKAEWIAFTLRDAGFAVRFAPWEIGADASLSRSTAIRQPIHAQERRVRQSLGQAQRKSSLAAPQRAGDISQPPDLPQLKSIAVPGPGKIESNAELGARTRKAGQLDSRRRLPSGKVIPQAAHPFDLSRKLTQLIIEYRLVCGEGRLQAAWVSLQHARDLGEAETKRTKRRDLGGTGHLARTIGPPSGFCANRRDQATLLVNPQSFDRHTEPASGLGRVQESSC